MLFGFGFVLGASILLLTAIIFVFPSISMSLMSPMLQNTANRYYHTPSLGHMHFDASSGTTTTSVDTTMATNSTSSSPPELLKNSSNNNQRKTKRSEKSFSNSSLLLVDLPRGGEFVNTNDNSHDNSIGTASNFSGSSNTPNDAKKQEKSCDSSDGDCDIFE
ncbi:hypothetical protein MKX01_025753, partial [Papaver californicum]